jgi:tetratricopeptide (TPR) repeat protein
LPKPRRSGTEKLVRYSLLAGEQALIAYAFQVALTYFESALAAKEGQPTDADTAALYFGLFRAQVATRARQGGGHEEPAENQRRVFDYYFQTGDAEAAVAVAQFSIFAASGIDLGRTNLISQALTLVPTDSLDAGFLLAELGACLFDESSDYDGAKEAFAQALVIAEREHDLLLEMRTLHRAQEADMWNFQWQDVLERGRRVIELAQLLDDPRTEVLTSYEMIRVLAAMGEISEAQRLSKSMLAPAERLAMFPR